MTTSRLSMVLSRSDLPWVLGSTHCHAVGQLRFHDLLLQQLDVALPVDALVVRWQLLVLVPGGCAETRQTAVPVASEASN